ncbi:MAG TPA: flagellar type III secretion system protein FlhB [Burkholderiaceae bacterium]|nr:flagellar type III secretion system protein FlhB [Burkholderiaceae bacterium]
MAAQDSQDRQLPATARRRSKAREEGQVARSRDLGHFAAMAAGLGLLMAAAPQAVQSLRGLLAAGLRFDARTLAAPEAMVQRLCELGLQMLWIIVPAGAFLAAVGVAASLLCGGWVWTFQPLMPQFDRLNPLAGLPRLISRRQLGDTLKSVGVALVLGAIGAAYLYKHIDALSGVQALALPAALGEVGRQMLAGLVLIVLALALFAAVDVPLQLFLHSQRLRMSHQEVKQEHKEIEGNQEVKGKMKVRMREMANRRMLAAVPKADLVVMNPTHYAVALKYDEATMAAPRVVAKGADLMALRIRDTAKTAQVPVLQAAPLARALYAHAEVDREVPLALYSAVAQVLAYVYRLRAALSGRAPLPGELPVIAVPDELDPHHPNAQRAIRK